MSRQGSISRHESIGKHKPDSSLYFLVRPSFIIINNILFIIRNSSTIYIYISWETSQISSDYIFWIYYLTLWQGVLYQGKGGGKDKQVTYDDQSRYPGHDDSKAGSKKERGTWK